MDITVVINTFQRSEKAIVCLRSILKNDFKNYQIIVIDQGKGEELGRLIEHLNEKRIIYFNFKNLGVSSGKNFGIKKATGKIIVFTDDDCLPNKNWLKEINKNFRENKSIDAVFGRVLPYKPEKHKGLVCPSIFNKEKERIITKPCRHWQEIGFGNNMSFRRKLFEKIDGFKEWLGPGAIGLAAEDAEICYRLFLNDYKILFQPKAVVYHNRWLKKGSRKWKKQMRFYSCGELAAYGFYAFQGDELGKEVVKEHLKMTLLTVYSQLKKSIKNISLKILWDIGLDIRYDIRGFLIAFWFAKKSL